MKILVYVRQVLSAGELVEIDRDHTRVDDSRAKFQPHPTDESSVEEAVRLKESVEGEATVTVVCIGPERTQRDLESYLAVGADEAIRVWDEALVNARLDDGAVGHLLADVAERVSPDWIFCGDDSTTSLAGYLSEMLEVPAATAVRAIEATGDGLEVRRKMERSTVRAAVSAPGILAIARGHTPRYPSHRDRLMAKRKTVTVLGSAELRESIQQAVSSTARLEVDAITLPKPGKKNYPPAEDGFGRYVALLLGGMDSGDAGGQMVEDAPEILADAAVKKIESLGFWS